MWSSLPRLAAHHHSLYPILRGKEMPAAEGEPAAEEQGSAPAEGYRPAPEKDRTEYLND